MILDYSHVVRLASDYSVPSNPGLGQRHRFPRVLSIVASIIQRPTTGDHDHPGLVDGDVIIQGSVIK